MEKGKLYTAWHTSMLGGINIAKIVGITILFQTDCSEAFNILHENTRKSTLFEITSIV